jgi:type II secretory pathway component PulL
MKTVELILPPLHEGGTWRSSSVQTSASRGPSRILLAPGALVMARNVEALGRTDAQARAATLSRLAPDMATPTSECVCALSPVQVSPAQGDTRTAHVMARGALAALIDRAKANGHAPDAVIADFALLPAPAAGGAIVAQHGDCIVRTATDGFACAQDLLPLLLGGRQVQEVDFESAAAACIRQGRHLALPNLIVAGGGAKVSAPLMMPIAAAMAATAALSIFAALPWIEAGRLNAATAQLRAEAVAVARKALPNAQQIINPVAQLREAGLPRARAAAGLENAVTVVEGLARAPGVAIARLSFDGEAVTAHVGVPNTSLLQPMRDHIAASGLQLVETPGLSEPNSIPVELTVTAAP